jgi:hypothetical protein
VVGHTCYVTGAFARIGSKVTAPFDPFLGPLLDADGAVSPHARCASLCVGRALVSKDNASARKRCR